MGMLTTVYRRTDPTSAEPRGAQPPLARRPFSEVMLNPLTPTPFAAGEIMGRMWGAESWAPTGGGGPGGGIPEAPNDGLLYGRRNTAWDEVIGGTPLLFNRGLTVTGDTVDLDLAGPTVANLGGVAVPARTATQGLQNTAGLLTAPVATPALAGVIVDAPVDGFDYMRRGTTWRRAVGQTFFMFNAPLVITGAEAQDQAYTFIIPAVELPAQGFGWMTGGNGYGTPFLTNENSTGIPSGSWSVDISEGAAWVTVGSYTSLTPLFTDPDMMVRPTTSGAGINRVFHRAPGDDITFRLRRGSTATVGAATLIIGLHGMIVAFN